MSAFQEKDEHLFFGREEFVEQLLNAVKQHSLVPVIGASGSGKSSVVFAGLIPQLKAEGTWLIDSFRPGYPDKNPFKNLASALVCQLETQITETDKLIERNKLSKALEQSDILLSEVIARTLTKYSKKHFLLVIDQFEELYKPDVKEEERHNFLNKILDAINAIKKQNNYNFTLLLTVRTDFIPFALSYQPFAEAWSKSKSNHQWLLSMSRQELKAVIEEPVKNNVKIADKLTERIINAVESKAGYLPLLEFALTKLWEKRFDYDNELTHQAYEEIGGVENALANHAQEEYEKLTEAEPQKAQQIFIQLVYPGQGTEDTRRLATRSEVGIDNWDVVTKLADARLLVTGNRELETTANSKEPIVALEKNEPTVEIIHEALIQKWERLREWINNDREFRTWQERLRSSMLQWKNSKKDRGALLRGSLLEEAKEKLDSHPNYLSDDEKKYIKSSSDWNKLKNFIISLTSIGSFTLLAIAILSAYQAIRLQQGIKLEQAGVNSLFQFKSGELSSLVSAMQSTQDLQKLIGNRNNPKDYPAVSPILALQKILDDIHEQNYFDAGQGDVKGTVFLPDGKSFITAGEGKENKELTLQIWNLAGKKEASLQGHEGGLLSGVNAVSVGGNAQNPVIASAGEDGTVRLWNKSGQQIKQLVAEGKPNYDSFTSIAVTPDGQKIIAGKGNGTVYLWDNKSAKQLKTWVAHGKKVTAISFSKNGQTLATSGNDGLARIWTVTGNKLGELKHPQIKRMLGVSLSPDGKFVATASDDNRARIWTVNGQEVRRLEGHQGWVTVVNFSPNGQNVATGSDDGSVKLWNAKTGENLQDFRGHRGAILSASFSLDGKQFVSTGKDGFVRLWNLADRPLQGLELTGFKDDVNAIAFSPDKDGKYIAGAGNEGVMRLWDAASGKELKVWKEAIQRTFNSPNNVQDIAFSPDGKFIVAGGLKIGIARVWNLAGSLTEPQVRLKGKEEKQEAHQNSIRSVAVSPDSQLIATGSHDKTMRIWKPNSPNGELVAVIPAQEGVVSRVLFTADGRRIVTADWEGNVAIWDLAGQLIRQWKKVHSTQIRGLGVTKDGKWIVTAALNGNVKILDDSGSTKREFFSYQSGVNELIISPDGQLIATGGMDGTVKIWDFQGRQVAEFRNPKGWIWGIAFSPDGKRIALAGEGGFVSVKSIEPLSDLMKEGCSWLHNYLTLHPSENNGLCQ